MSDSSDSEIIQRKRQNVRKAHYSSDDNSSDIINDSEVIEGDFEPLFHEIFGKGDEYDYIYKDQNKEEKIEVLSDKKISPQECFEYIKKQVKGYPSKFSKLSYDVVKDLLEGYSPEYLAFHCNKMDLWPILSVVELIDEYRSFSSHPHRNEYIDSLLSAKLFSGFQEDLNIKGILNISEYVKNMMSFDTVVSPVSKINAPAELSKSNTSALDSWADEHLPYLGSEQPESLDENQKQILLKTYKKVISQISSNPVFIDRVSKAQLVEILEPDNYLSSEFSFNFLKKIYLNGDGSFDDLIRAFIIDEAYKHAPKEFDFALSKLLPKEVGREFDYQTLVNLIVSLKGKSGSYAGVFYDRNLLSVVKIDEYGEIYDSKVFKDFETKELQSFLFAVDNVIVTSNTPNVKFLLSSVEINYLYLPKTFSYFNDFKELSIPYNIASAVQNPIIYFSRLLHCIKNKINVKNSPTNNTSVLEKAILSACAIHNLELRNALSHKYGYTFFNILGIDLTDPDFNLENLDRLDQLKQIFNNFKYTNICTYFCLSNSEKALDSTYLHPNNYSFAAILCKGAYHKLLSDKNDAIMSKEKYDVTKDEEKILELFVEKPSLLENFGIPSNFSLDDIERLNSIKSIMMRQNEVVFSGANDTQIFNDIVLSLEIGKIYSGTVSRVGNDFYILSVDSTTVFARKTCELVVNQIVDVEILERAEAKLNYSGQIIERKDLKIEKFRAHCYFRDLDQYSLEEYMKKERMSIAIRPSSQEQHCVVVCRLDSNIFACYKLNESCKMSDHSFISYEYKEKTFVSLDSFISTYIKDVYELIRKIRKFKYFFNSASEAVNYLQTPGEFLKYAVILSTDNPGYLEFFTSGKRIFAKLDGNRFVIKNTCLETVEDLVAFIKINNKNL